MSSSIVSTKTRNGRLMNAPMNGVGWSLYICPIANIPTFHTTNQAGFGRVSATFMPRLSIILTTAWPKPVPYKCGIPRLQIDQTPWHGTERCVSWADPCHSQPSSTQSASQTRLKKAVWNQYVQRLKKHWAYDSFNPLHSAFYVRMQWWNGNPVSQQHRGDGCGQYRRHERKPTVNRTRGYRAARFW